MVIFVKILIFSKIMVKIGGSIESLIGITSKAENPAADRRPPSKIEQGDCPEKIS